MSIIERRDSQKNVMNSAIIHLVIGSTLDSLGLFIIVSACLFPDFNPLALKSLPLSRELLCLIGGLLIIVSLFFLKKGIFSLKKSKSEV